MRRTDDEFKAEIIRRSDEYIKRRKKRRTQILVACLPIVLCIMLVEFLPINHHIAEEAVVNVTATVECYSEETQTYKEYNSDIVSSYTNDFVRGLCVIESIEIQTQQIKSKFYKAYTEEKEIENVYNYISMFLGEELVKNSSMDFTLKNENDADFIITVHVRELQNEGKEYARKYILFDTFLFTEDGNYFKVSQDDVNEFIKYVQNSVD